MISFSKHSRVTAKDELWGEGLMLLTRLTLEPRLLNDL